MRIVAVLMALVFGAGLAAQGQEIDVVRQGVSVLVASTVNLGDVDVGETTQVGFTIQNEGSTNLTLIGAVTVTDTDDCSATVQQPGLMTIPPAGSTTFQVHITDDGGSTFSCDISIYSDDTDEGTYQFIIQGRAQPDDSKNKDETSCSTATGTGGILMIGGLVAFGALTLRRRKRVAA